MSKYKITRRKGLGYVYFQIPENSVQAKIDSIQTNTKVMSNIQGQHLTPELLASDPTRYKELIAKRDDNIIKILDIWKVPYTRDNTFGSATVSLSPEQLDIPLNDAVIIDENGNQVPVETVINDSSAQVIITNDTIEVKSSKKLVYVGLGVLALAGLYLASKKKKTSK